MTAQDESIDTPMTQVDYAERRLEERDTGTSSASALLAAFACGFGVLALWFAPMILGFIGIGCGIVALVIAGDRDRPARIGLTIAVLGWLIGSIIGIAVNHSVVSLNLT
jgi:hypothetical protein